MVIETAARSRRALLMGALGAAAAFAAQAIGRPLNTRAANDDPVLLGHDHTESSLTSITSSDSTALTLLTTTAFGAGLKATVDYPTGTTYGVSAISKSNHGIGVIGRAGAVGATTGSATGVVGSTTSPAGLGVKGEATHSSGATFGVYGVATSTAGTGVFGTGKLYGVHGKAMASAGPGVYGEGFGSGTSARGVMGFSSGGQGVRGDSDFGIGVYATATNGTALSAVGKVHFSRSGWVDFGPPGITSKAVSLPGVTPSSLVFAVLARFEPGRHVSAVVPTGGSFTIYLNGSLLNTARCNWFVLD